ncbi:GNAT family N-acetyltransferase [Sphingomonas sp. ID0503]|uniref:GNAT family N-acetyltransferase n=1 Tax=Sphingomonas sp. ID0503 TaxID=3399691 RepID=UPI003AFA9F30
MTPIDQAPPKAVEALLDAAFGKDRHQRTAYRLREGANPVPELSLAAFDNASALAGVLQSWPVALVDGEGGRHPMVLVGPVAVRPDLQREGLGRRMMEAMLAKADAAAEPALMLIGDPEYYGRFFGFSAVPTQGWSLPGPFERHRLLARLAPGVTLPAEGSVEPARAVLPAGC